MLERGMHEGLKEQGKRGLNVLIFFIFVIHL